MSGAPVAVTPCAWDGLGIRRRYAVAVVAVAAVESTLAWRIGTTSALPAFACLGAVGSVASLIDLRTHRLPNRVILPSYPVVVALLAVASGIGHEWWPFDRAVIAMALVAGFYIVLGLGFTHGLGLGDVKLGGLLALGLGWLGWPILTTGVLAAWGLAALATLAVHVMRPRQQGRTIALGPFLCLGALAAVVIR
jgi:leader peptidase (prepilin peptidase)/N-methyltransferase